MAQEKYTESISGRVLPGTWDKFKASIPPRGKVGESLTAALLLWASLPREGRKAVLDRDNQDSDSFVRIVRQIVDERIAEGLEGARVLVAHPRRKRGRKD